MNITQKEAKALENKPEVVCLCGSTRFYKEFEEQNFRLTLEGKIVLSIGCNTKSGKGLSITAQQKKMLDSLHKRKIDLADRVLVLNVGGYIGESTKGEIAYAKEQGKPVDYLWDMGEYKTGDAAFDDCSRQSGYEWIPVFKRLPDDGGIHYVTVSGKYIDHGCFDKSSGEWRRCDDRGFIKNVTHWFPMPEAPGAVSDVN